MNVTWVLYEKEIARLQQVIEQLELSVAHLERLVEQYAERDCT